MQIKMHDGVIEYMKKHSSPCLVIDMDRNVTNPGCGCGRTKTFYTPSIRLGFEEKSLVKTHSGIKTDGATVYISKMIKDEEGLQIEIFIEKTLMLKKLATKGISIIVTD